MVSPGPADTALGGVRRFRPSAPMDETYPLAIRRTNDPFKTSKIQVMTDPWNPSLYGRFADERALPFHELLALVTAGALGRAVDLGCGSGSLTALAVDRLHQIQAGHGTFISQAFTW